MKKMQLALVAFAALSAALFGGLWWHLGTVLLTPNRHAISKPADPNLSEVSFTDEKNHLIRAWWMREPKSVSVVLLVHGIHADKRALLERARFVNRLGYSALLIDLPGHGESGGDHVTFGPDEGSAVSAALKWIKVNNPNCLVGADGLSLGGAGILLREENSGFDAVVVEAVFPDIRRALKNRLSARFSWIGPLLEPLFIVQLKVRLGLDLDQLSPSRQISKVGCPVLVLGGERDSRTKLTETKELFDNASEPKQLCVFSGCGHDDFLARQPTKYHEVVGRFFKQYLK